VARINILFILFASLLLEASTSLTRTQRVLRARMAANTRWSDPQSRSAHADRRLERFAAEVDPDGKLPEPERIALAKQRRRAYMQRLALASSKARAARKAGGDRAAS
jgi:hypothetical protein